jgi:hypothetical protein
VSSSTWAPCWTRPCARCWARPCDAGVELLWRIYLKHLRAPSPLPPRATICTWPTCTRSFPNWCWTCYATVHRARTGRYPRRRGIL